MVDMKDADISQHCLVHGTHCSLDQQEPEDLFVWGPPCPPYSVSRPSLIATGVGLSRFCWVTSSFSGSGLWQFAPPCVEARWARTFLQSWHGLAWAIFLLSSATKVLNTKKRRRGYNPFREPGAEPFLEGARYIRGSAIVWVFWLGGQLDGSEGGDHSMYLRTS